MREIRLYPNRRLYDCVTVGYIMFDDILALILDGFDVRIRDSLNGRDCTRRVLMDILVRQESKVRAQGPSLFTNEALRELIRLHAGDRRLLGEFLEFSLQNAPRGPEDTARDSGSASS